MAKKNNNPYREFLIIRSETILYAICTNIVEAEGMRKHHEMPFDIWGPIAARSHEEVVQIAQEDLKLRLSSRMKSIYYPEKKKGKRKNQPA